MTEQVICAPIEIKGSMSRHEIVQKVVNTFITTEHEQRGRGVKFWYPVEHLPAGLQQLPKDDRLLSSDQVGCRNGISTSK